MIKFFRHIRQDMIDKNRIVKYLLYAVGEIVLVVIGILIALQINNWNEMRKQRVQEHKFLTSLKADLMVDLESLDAIMAERTSKVNCSNMLMYPQAMDTPQQVRAVDSLIGRVMGWVRFVPRTNTMEELISSGNLNIISNDSIKYMLLTLKEDHQQNDIYTEHMRHEYDKYLYDRHSALREGGRFINREASFAADSLIFRQPSDEELALLVDETNRFLSDKQVRNGLRLASMNNYGLLRLYKKMKVKIYKLVGMINHELNHS